jgi:hypothetical protein
MSGASSRSASTARHRTLRCAALLAAISLIAASGTACAAITRTRAAAIVGEINLRHSDLPTSTQQPNPYTAKDKRIDARFNTCDHGVQDQDALGFALSPNFVLPGTSSVIISSEVEVRLTAALVVRDLAASASPLGLSCNNSATEGIFRVGLFKSQTLTVRSYRLPSPGYGTLHAFAVRTVVDIRTTTGTTEVTVPTYNDELGFGDGQVEVGFAVLESAAVPSAALEHRMMAALVARTQAAVG